MKLQVYFMALVAVGVVFAGCAPADQPVEEVTFKEVAIEEVILGAPSRESGKVTTCGFRLRHGDRLLTYYIDDETAIGRSQQFAKCVTLRRSDLLTVIETTSLKDGKRHWSKYRWRAGSISDELS